MTISKANALLNSKNKFHQTAIVRVVAASGLHGDPGESQEATIPQGWNLRERTRSDKMATWC